MYVSDPLNFDTDPEVEMKRIRIRNTVCRGHGWTEAYMLSYIFCFLFVKCSNVFHN